MEKNDQLHNMRHSAAHLLAQAVVELFPDTILTIGPVTETGFFYDFLPSKNFKEEDLEKIEAKMRELVKRDYKIVGKEVSKDEARKLFKGNKFKLEIIDQLAEGDSVSIYSQGDFFDLCKGGHVESTGKIKHFKLTNISGSYWRANREGEQLQRISGVCFLTKEELDAYLQHLEDVQKYDHRRLGKQLDLFSFHDEAPGMPFFHQKGLAIYNKMIDWLRYARGTAYQEIKTPLIMNESLWKTSGHYDNYKEHMYFTSADEVPCCVRPMNCPGSILVYKDRPRSYRELPLRLSEFGFVHRFELSGVMHGLFRVRAFTIDDAHHYCTMEQIESEVIFVLKLIEKVYSKFGFNKIRIALATRPEKYIGSLEVWDQATNALKRALEANKIDYKIQEGDGAFYGPKLEIKVEDAMGREWQCGTVQVDPFMPMNFGLEYVDADQSRKTPFILHVAIYGSLERFMGILLEHFKGNFPFWIAPLQARVMTITDGQDAYANDIVNALLHAGIRVEKDHSGDQISAKIRRAQVDKVPWMLVVGQKEMDQKTITLRHPDGKQEFGLSLETLLERAKALNAF
jgi:threonyl-tRNA synthetase